MSDSILSAEATQKAASSVMPVRVLRTAQRRAGLAVMALVFACLTVLTTSNYFGDTIAYAGDIVKVDGAGSGTVKEALWESGHLFWRPLGFILYRALGGLTSYGQAGEHALAATAMLVAVTIMCGLACALLFYEIALLILSSRWVAILLATGFLSFYAFLNYVHTGSSYVPGLAGLLAGLWAALIAVERRNSTYACLSGLMVGLASLVWLPYVLSLPGLVVTMLLWSYEGATSPFRRRVRAAVFICAVAFAVIAIGYSLAILQLQILSPTDIAQWFRSASHGAAQSRRLIRLATGMPRSFIYVGNAGLLLKRYVLADPYAHTSFAYLAEHVFPRFAVFYLFAVPFCIALLRSAAGSRIFWILVAGTLPTLIFAVFIFEPGSTERYLPIYPFLYLAVAYVVTHHDRYRRIAIATVCFLTFTTANNVSALWKSSVQKANASAIARVNLLEGRVTPEGLVALVTFNDRVYQFAGSYPFHPVNRRTRLPIYDVIQVANVRVLHWKREFADRALMSLNQSAAVWVSRRVLAAQPDPAWDWVEGDDAHIAWRDIPGFFRHFSYSDSVGGEDGFIRLDASPANIASLQALRDDVPAE